VNAEVRAIFLLRFVIAIVKNLELGSMLQPGEQVLAAIDFVRAGDSFRLNRPRNPDQCILNSAL